MKVWLDDERPAPAFWVQVRTPEQAITLLARGGVEVISLDHDLGLDVKGDGYDVLLWIEEQVWLEGFKPPEMRIHTANPSARVRMEAAVKKIEQVAG